MKRSFNLNLKNIFNIPVEQRRQFSSEWRNKRDFIVKGNVSNTLTVPSDITRPPYITHPHIPLPSIQTYGINKGEKLKSLRYSAKKAAEALQYAGSLVKPGVTTDEIDRLTHEFIVNNLKAYPSPLFYAQSFPKSICTAVNEVVCHGIPDDKEIQDGDIVSIDVSLFIDGVNNGIPTHGDNCGTFLAGNVDDEGKTLVDVTLASLHEAINICKNGQPLNKIGEAIANVYEPHGYESVLEFNGHGIDEVFHRAPWIRHYRNTEPGCMVSGMIFTIEPMIIEGSAELAPIWDDGWTAVTQDKSRCAQFEHMLHITDEGCEILTQI